MTEVKSIAQQFGIKTPEKIDFSDNILLVEDQHDVRMIVAHHLNKLGYKKIKQCAEGHEAVQWLLSAPLKVSVTIAAMDAPLLGGVELLQEMRDSPEIQRGPFVLSMSNPDRNKIMLATESTVDGILVKPFSFNDLIPKIRQAFMVFHNPQNPEMVYEAAKDAFRQQDLDKADKIYLLLAQVTKKAARPYVGRARVALAKNQTEEAVQLLAEAQQRNPHYVPIYVLRGEILLQQGDKTSALEQFKHAISLSPLNPVRYEQTAQLMFDLKLYQESVDVLNIAVKHELSFPALHHHLSQAYVFLKEYRKAIQHIRNAISGDQENVLYLNQLGICFKEDGQSAEAMKAYNQVIKLDPANRSALYNKAILLESQEKVDEAIKTLKRCVEKHPEFTAALRKLEELEAKKAS